MKMLYVLAALLMASTAAHAGNSISFEINGQRSGSRRRRIATAFLHPDFGARPVRLRFGFKSSKSKPRRRRQESPDRSNRSAGTDRNDSRRPRHSTPQRLHAVRAGPASRPAPSGPATHRAGRRDGRTPRPARRYRTAPLRLPPSPRSRRSGGGSPGRAPTTPLGVWATEENKGNVRIEQCGPNLCGYAVKTGEKILINMKPSNANGPARFTIRTPAGTTTRRSR